MESTCGHCKVTFEAQRSSAKYCSNACKIAWHRLPDQLNKAKMTAIAALETLVTLSEEHEHLYLQAYEAIETIERHATDLKFNKMSYSKVVSLENEREYPNG